MNSAKQKSLQAAQSAWRATARERRESLRVPKPFKSASDFLSRIRAVAAARTGANRQMADACGVSTSTVSKWLGGKKCPQQASLDKIVAWWKSQEIAPDDAVSPREPRQASLARLPVELSLRLRKAAYRRGIKPLDYAAQILDRHLPRLEEML